MGAAGVESKSSPNEPHPNHVKEGDGKTWSQWAAEKALVAEHVASQGAVLVKDSALSTVKYVSEAATSKLHGEADPTTKDDVAYEQNKISVQDVVDRYSTARTSEGGQRSVTRASTMKERTLGMAESLKHSTATSVQDVVDRYSTARTSEGGQRSVTRASTMKERTLGMAESLKHSTATALTLGEGMMRAGGVEWKSSPNEQHPNQVKEGDGKTWVQWAAEKAHPNQVKEGDGKTWVQWAAEKALVAELVAAQGAGLVKDSAVSTVKYVSEAATSKLHGDADPTTKDDVAYGHNKIPVQDVVDRNSTTARTPEGGQRSVTRALTMKERTLSMAESLKQSTATALAPGEGDRELAETITASLSSLPTLLRERLWISSDSQDPAVTGPSVDGVVGAAAAAPLPESGESKSEASSAAQRR